MDKEKDKNINLLTLMGDKNYSNLLKTAIDMDPHFILIKDENLNYVLCNKSVLDFIGIEKYSDIIGRNVSDIITKKDELEEVVSASNMVMKKKQIMNTVEKITGYDGIERLFKITRMPIEMVDSNGTNKMYVLTIGESTLENINLNRGNNSETLKTFKMLVDSLPISIFILDEYGGYEFINRKGLSDFGAFGDFSDQLTSQEIHNDNIGVLLSGLTKEMTEIIKIKDSIKSWDTVKIPLLIDNRKYLVIFRSIDVEDEINDIRKEILTGMEKQVFFSMTTFISGIAHEFRTPIQSVKGGLELLKTRAASICRKTDCKICEEQIGLIDVLLSAADSMNNIVTNLANYGVAGKNIDPSSTLLESISKDIKLVNINNTIREVIKMIELTSLYKENIQSDEITVIFTDEIECFTSEYILKNILINLINNSIKAVKVREKNIQSDEDYKKQIQISFFETEKKEICIEVEDNGIGMSTDSVTGLFNPFYRANRDIPGIGMGLFISKFWATNTNMELKLKESKYGKTIFTLIIHSIEDSKGE